MNYHAILVLSDGSIKIMELDEFKPVVALQDPPVALEFCDEDQPSGYMVVPFKEFSLRTINRATKTIIYDEIGGKKRPVLAI